MCLNKQTIHSIQQRTQQIDHRIQKILQSNQRNSKRLLRHRARLQQLKKCKQSPQLLLAYSGIMNQYVQTFMISHNFQMNIDITNMNPDNMSYQQLLQLGQKIGKVSKGLSKQQIQQLQHIKITQKQQKQKQQCPICCNQFKNNQITLKVKCKHLYHEECIIQWLKDQNVCPICKKHVLGKEE